MTDQGTSPSELVHYGVKGMHWGTTKSDEPNPKYSSSARSADRQKYGNSGVNRINRRMNSGLTRKKAVSRENQRNTAIALGGASAVALSLVLAQHGPVLATHLSKLSETANGHAEIAKIFANHAAEVTKVKANRAAGKALSKVAVTQNAQLKAIKLSVPTKSYTRTNF